MSNRENHCAPEPCLENVTCALSLNLYDRLSGYFVTDKLPLYDITNTSFYLKHLSSLATIVHKTEKLFGVPSSIDLSRIEFNKSLEEHVKGFQTLVETKIANITVVHEGRGTGRGSSYWSTEIDKPVKDIDPLLQRILNFRRPDWSKNITYREAFTGSNEELFRILGNIHDAMSSVDATFQLWLNVEAFEFLRDSPCLPVDTRFSAMAEMMDKTIKTRIDMSLTASSADVQKVVTFAWDPGYTCTTPSQNSSLAEEIRDGLQNPILANCSFHSAENKSVVLLGYKLEGETQGFTVDWPDSQNQRHTDKVYGYYFELDYGMRHNRVPSLQYVQLYDVPNVDNLAMRGYVVVTAERAHNPCIFSYSFV